MPSLSRLLSRGNDSMKLSRRNQSSLEPRFVFPAERMPLAHKVIRQKSHLQAAETGKALPVKMKQTVSTDKIGETMGRNRRNRLTKSAILSDEKRLFYQVAGKLRERGCYFTLPDSIRYSPICTAFSAAPLRIWSPVSQRVRPLSTAKSWRTRPT